MYLITLLVLCLALARSQPLSASQDRASLAAPTLMMTRAVGGAPNITQTTQNTPLVQGLAPSIALMAVILAGATYVTLIRYTPDLSQGISMPKALVEEAIGTILTRIWLPEFSQHLLEDSTEVLLGFPVRRWPMYVIQKPGISNTKTEMHWPRGYEDQLKEIGSLQGASATQAAQRQAGESKHRQIWIYAASPAPKALVQIAVWEYASFWISMLMVANTIIYNGFIYGNPGPDAWLRLALVLMYSVINLSHLVAATMYLRSCLTDVTKQVCWTLLSRGLTFSTRYEYTESIIRQVPDWAAFRKLQSLFLGEITQLKTFKAVSVDDYGTKPQVCLIEHDTPETKFTDSIKPMRESEIKNLEKQVESCVEKMIANVLVMLGVSLAAGVAPFTSVPQPTNSATAQIGSYALLLALATGLAALLGSITHLSNVAESLKQLTLYQNCVISATKQNHGQDVQQIFELKFGKNSRQKHGTAIDLVDDKTNDSIRSARIGTLFKGFSFKQILGACAFGPAWAFVPQKNAVQADGEIGVDIGDKAFRFDLDGNLYPDLVGPRTVSAASDPGTT